MHISLHKQAAANIPGSSGLVTLSDGNNQPGITGTWDIFILFENGQSTLINMSTWVHPVIVQDLAKQGILKLIPGRLMAY